MNIYSASISSKELKRLSALRPWRTVLALVLDWLVIAAAIAASEYSGSVWVYLFAVALIAGRMHAFGVLMHEAAHFRFLRDRRASEWIMDVFAAWPVLATVDGYRQNHLAHHQHTNTEKDPDWIAKLGTAAYTFPQKVWHAALQLFGYLVAINSFRDMAQILPRISKNDRSTLQYKLAAPWLLRRLGRAFHSARHMARRAALLDSAVLHAVLHVRLHTWRRRAFRQHGL